MKKLIILIALIALLAAHAVCGAATYYIDPDCANNGNGTAYTPCAASPGSAGPYNTTAISLAAGNTYAIKAGSIVTVQKDIGTSGTAEGHMVFRAYDPNTGVFTTNKATVDSEGVRSRAFSVIGRQYIDFMDLIITGGAGSGILHENSSDITYTRVVFTDNYYGLNIAAGTGASNNVTITDCTFSSNTMMGLLFNPLSTSSNLLVDRCTSYSNSGDGITVRTGTNNIIQNSLCYDNGEDGFDYGGLTGSIIFRRNISHNNASAGFSAKANAAGTIGYYYGNVAYNNHEGVEVGNVTGTYGYNNTVFDNHYGIHIDESSSSHTWINNIFDNNGEDVPATGLQVSWLKPGSTLVSDYNSITPHSLGRTIYDKTETSFDTLAQWQSENNQDANSITTDPLIDSQGRPKANSPVIEAGTWINGGLYSGNAFAIGAYDRTPSVLFPGNIPLSSFGGVKLGGVKTYWNYVYFLAELATFNSEAATWQGF